MAHTSPPKDLPMPGPVPTSWTELHIPLSKTIEDEKSEDGKKWYSLTTYHNPEKTPGFRISCFGRVTETPEKVWYITAWESEASLDEFEKTEDYRLQQAEHEKLSTEPLKTHRVAMRGFFWQHLHAGNIGFLDVYFPSDISEEAKAIANKARGLVYHYAPGDRSKSAYVARPVRGWVSGTREYEGREAVVLRFLHYWKSKESESQFKAGATITVPREGKAHYLTLWDHLLETLEEAGSLGIEEFHGKFVLVRNYWTDPTVEDDDDEEYVV